VDIIVNGEPRNVPPKMSVAELLVDLEVAGRPVAVEVNRELVPRAHHAAHILRDGDRLEIVTLVGGG
jgi:sulfur carrier protein